MVNGDIGSTELYTTISPVLYEWLGIKNWEFVVPIPTPTLSVPKPTSFEVTILFASLNLLFS